MKQINHPAARKAASTPPLLSGPQRGIDPQAIGPWWLADDDRLQEGELDEILMLATDRCAVDLTGQRFAQ